MGIFDKTPQVRRDPLEKASVAQQFDRYLEPANNMLSEAMEYRIKDQASMEHAVAMLGEAVKFGKDLEAQRKKVVKAPNEFVKFVNSLVKKFTDSNKKTGILNEVERVLKKKITEHTVRQEMARREKERIAQEEAKALQAAIDKEAEAKGIEAVSLPPIAEAQVDTVTRSSSGASVSMARVWKAEIVDMEGVERKFCSPDMKKINEAVKAGLREAPGLRIYQDTVAKLRT